jgi:hypothetical protein
MIAVPKGRSQVEKTFGDPELNGGGINEVWRKAKLISIPLPYAMRYAYDIKVIIKEAQIHRLIAHEFISAFQEVWDSARDEMKKKYGYNETTVFYDNKTRAYLRLLGLDLFGGTFVYRRKRGSLGLSMHAYGIAFDLDPANNAQGTKGRMPAWVVVIFKKWGFTWGGLWKGKSKDPMHFQYATGC